MHSDDVGVVSYAPGSLSFRCNICGGYSARLVAELDRERPSCSHCRSTVRWRGIIHVLSLELFGESLALQEFPHRPDLRGVGMSDWDGYAIPLAHQLGYTNTFYHQEPRLDIADPDLDPALDGTLDFIISSEVFEHIVPPVSRAFVNMRRLLKPNGVAVFTVPYGLGEATVEHFPELHDFEIKNQNGDYVLENRTADGRLQCFDDLTFHGGPGATLEMRLFSESALIQQFREAGFDRIRIHREPCFDHGVYWKRDWSLPISARRPQSSPSP